jgi:hypothetical protein
MESTNIKICKHFCTFPDRPNVKINFGDWKKKFKFGWKSIAVTVGLAGKCGHKYTVLHLKGYYKNMGIYEAFVNKTMNRVIS